ncbi:MAG: restriction endonuclease subunit S [Spirochaetales bacterium]|nr:restriction endonuclease subunit S [Spirochaetales bacterium]
MRSYLERTLGDLLQEGTADLQTGPFGTMLKAAEYTHTGVPVIAVQDIGHNRFHREKLNYISHETAQRLNRYRVVVGDIVFGRKGAVDRRAIVSAHEAGWIQGSDCIRLRLSSEVNSSFVAHQLGTLKEWLIQHAHGATMPSLNQDILALLPILLPPLPEQKAIAAVLSSLDDKIDLLHRQNKTLEAMAETLFRQWFVEEADDSWEEGKLSSLFELQSGFAFKSDSFVDSGPFRLITIKAVKDAALDLNNASYIEELPARMPEHCRLKLGDILLSLTGNVGRCCFVDKEQLLLNQRVAKIHPRHPADRAFAYIFFRLESTKQILIDLAKGTAQANLSPIETGDLNIPIPPENIRKRFSESATPIWNRLLLNKLQINTLEKLRDTLLPKLMSGEVRVAL